VQHPQDNQSCEKVIMSGFDVAKRFFEACEQPLGWDGCREYVAEGAPFTAQCEPLEGIDTVEAYCEWMKAFATVTAPGATYDLHTSSYDEATRTAVFFATFNATHSGEGGPVPPTGKTMNTHYVYAVRIGDDEKVAELTKIWNAPWAMKQVGWV
jgi:hypothetical protein